MDIISALNNSYTQYQAADEAVKLLVDNGFVRLSEQDEWKIREGGKYFVCRGGCAVIAFTIGEGERKLKTVASHLDSPALKIKYAPVMEGGSAKKLSVECYGGGIWHTFMDTPLAVAGRVVYERKGEITSKSVVYPQRFVIPSVAIHLNRKVNEGVAINPQVDLSALFSLTAGNEYFEKIVEDGRVVDYDLYLVNDTSAFLSGAESEFLSARGLDDRACAFLAVDALTKATGEGINIAYLASSEEIGSATAEGADADFFVKTVKRIARALKMTDEQLDSAVARSVLLSADNAHALHPNHPELSDPTNKTVLGGGITVKYHAGGAYTTNALTATLVHKLMERAGVKTQRYFVRSDLRSGSTLGAIVGKHLTMASADIGIAQLAMHSSLETVALSDIDEMGKGLLAFYNAKFSLLNESYKLD